MQTALDALKKHFGYSEFHPMQEDIIKDVLDGRDVFVLMPTGSGKSLCYQLPAVINEGVTVVISPLIALMKDQVDSLKANGIAASFINSSLTAEEIHDAKVRLLESRDKILYIAPERLASGDFISFLKLLKISLFAIDESHCISEWGHDFRPEYRKLKIIREVFPAVPIIALTATAIQDVQSDIVQALKIFSAKTYKASFNRPNLSYYVRPKEEAYEQIADYIRKHRKDSGIIYCQSRRSAENIAKSLQEDGFRALPYHAGLPADVRIENQESFIKDDAEIIVATIAFGMGINKPDVRYVIHYDLPKNIEGYYQETGRAGRDGIDSDCILFFSYGDRKKIELLIEKSRSPQKKAIAYRKLGEMIKFCESPGCRRKFLLGYFGERYADSCGKCDVCINPRETFDGTEIAEKAIACIKDVNQRFGMNYIISIITGSAKGTRAPAYGHDKIGSYGVGIEYSRKQWQIFIRELVQNGLIEVAGNKYPVLKLNQKSVDILSGKASVFLTKPNPAKETIIISQDGKTTSEADHNLFEILRSLRKSIADSENVPPYIIFHDSTLREMATFFPQSIHSFTKIKGVGGAKLEKYGNAFLEKIIGYCSQNNISERKITRKSTVKTDASGTYSQTLDLLRQGISIPEIAAKRGLAVSTIVTHTEKLISSGEDIDIDNFVAKERQEAILSCMKKIGTQGLTQIIESLGDNYSYDEIRLVRAKLNARKS